MRLFLFLIPLLAICQDEEAAQIEAAQLVKVEPVVQIIKPISRVQTTTYNAVMNISFSSNSLKAIYREELKAARMIGNGTYMGMATYPIELPNIEVNSIKTTTGVKAGIKIGLDTEN
jgi:hypothetical protein